MDRLEHMFDLQNKLQERLGTWDKIRCPADKQAFLNQNFLAMFEETVEIMRETPYKNPEYTQFGWKRTQIGDKNKLLNELSDIFHFLMNICIANGFTAEDFYAEYCKKNNVNHVRQDTGY